MKRTKYLFSIFSVGLILSGFAAEGELSRAAKLKRLYESGDRNYVFVALHRGDWLNNPENSLSAIRGAIAMGADIMELDAQRTKDGNFVVSHDGSIDRCTDGKGGIGSLTLADALSHRLKERNADKNCQLTDEFIPTLEQALLTAKGKILVNIDRSENWPVDIMAVVKKLGMEDEVIFKSAKNLPDTVKKFDVAWQDCTCADSKRGPVEFMPILWCYNPTNSVNLDIAREWLALKNPPRCYEVCFGKDEVATAVFDLLKSDVSKPRIWVNVMWGSLCAGHHDGWYNKQWKGRDPEKGWGWVIDQGATILQTDHPQDLIEYLNARNLHNL